MAEVVFIFCIHLIQVVTVIVVCEVVSFHITTNKVNYRQYHELARHFWSQMLTKAT